jgi:hypothetical protein
VRQRVLTVTARLPIVEDVAGHDLVIVRRIALRHAGHAGLDQLKLARRRLTDRRIVAERKASTRALEAEASPPISDSGICRVMRVRSGLTLRASARAIGGCGNLSVR